jgi:hypothetical protein
VATGTQGISGGGSFGKDDEGDVATVMTGSFGAGALEVEPVAVTCLSAG